MEQRTREGASDPGPPAHERRRLREVLYPWAWRAGSRSADLICLDYEAELGTDLEELRHKWRITPAPREQ